MFVEGEGTPSCKHLLTADTITHNSLLLETLGTFIGKVTTSVDSESFISVIFTDEYDGL